MPADRAFLFWRVKRMRLHNQDARAEAQDRRLLDNLDVFKGTYNNLTILEGLRPFPAGRVGTPEGIRAV